METLFDQPVRDRHDVSLKIIESSCEEMKNIANRLKMNVSDVIEVYKIEVIERAIYSYIDDGDRKDEQLAGFGKLLKSLNESMGKAVEILETKNADNQ